MFKKKLKEIIPPILLSTYYFFKFKLIYIKYRNFFIKNAVLKNSMSEQRCFILGSGHSIDSIDITRFKDENIIGLNSFMFHDKYKEIIKKA
jgi:hypothetical protein